jgi:SpoVK/Ycf46/Vps4 family AAA+-type ATPase
LRPVWGLTRVYRKAIANQAKATFFSVSVADMGSKWQGESEMMVQILFIVARIKQPSVVFVDEIDSLLSSRGDDDDGVARKVKTEFMKQMQGVNTQGDEKLLVVGATNRPWDLDEAIIRRLSTKLFIPLPEISARRALVSGLLHNNQHSLQENDLDHIADCTDGYSCDDVKKVCQEAGSIPRRELLNHLKALNVDIATDKSNPRAICMDDFSQALKSRPSTVTPESITDLLEWNMTFGTKG